MKKLLITITSLFLTISATHAGLGGATSLNPNSMGGVGAFKKEMRDEERAFQAELKAEAKAKQDKLEAQERLKKQQEIEAKRKEALRKIWEANNPELAKQQREAAERKKQEAQKPVNDPTDPFIRKK